MKLREVQGDLFELDASEWPLAHCISADVTAKKYMDKGIAKLFRNKYLDMAKEIFPQLEVGKAVRYEKNGHVIYNLVPKHRVGQKAKGSYEEDYYRQLRESLEDVREEMTARGETKLGMPRIASGLDGGDWDQIRQMIEDTFQGTEIEVQVRYL